MGSYALSGLFGGLGEGLNSLVALKMALQDREDKARERESEEAARRLAEIATRARLDEAGVRFGERPQENTTVRLPDPNVIKGSGLLTPDIGRMGEPSFRPPMSLGDPRMEAPPMGMRGPESPDLMGILREAVNRPQGPTAEMAPRFRDMPGTGAYVDTNATDAARSATREERLGQERQPQPRNLDPRSPEGMAADEERKRRGLLGSSGSDADDDAARIAEGEEDEIENHIAQRMNEYLRPVPIRNNLGDVTGQQPADREEAHGRAIEDAIILHGRVPRRWIEQAAQNPAYADHLREHGIDPVTGRKVDFSGVESGSSTGGRPRPTKFGGMR